MTIMPQRRADSMALTGFLLILFHQCDGRCRRTTEIVASETLIAVDLGWKGAVCIPHDLLVHTCSEELLEFLRDGFWPQNSTRACEDRPCNRFRGKKRIWPCDGSQAIVPEHLFHTARWASIRGCALPEHQEASSGGPISAGPCPDEGLAVLNRDRSPRFSLNMKLER